MARFSASRKQEAYYQYQYQEQYMSMYEGTIGQCNLNILTGR